MNVAPAPLERQTTSFRTRVQHAHSSWDLWAIGITIVIGGQFFSWNVGVVSGSLGFGISLIIVASAYVCLACSMAEMSSMLPFAGGVYGLSRCTLGFSFGFILGCFEILEYVLYISSINVTLGYMISSWWPVLEPYEPVVWLFSHCISLLLLVLGGKVYWRFNFFLACLLLTQVAMYCFGSLSYADMNKYSGGSEFLFNGGFKQWFTSFPMAMWFFAGIESLNTLCNEVDEPQMTIPKGQVWSIITLVATAIAVYLVSISLSPGAPDLPSVLVVSTGGISQLFNLTEGRATLYGIPACFAGIPGFLLTSSTIVTAMAESKLFPHALQHRNKAFGTRIRALVLVALLSFSFCFLSLTSQLSDITLYCLSMFFASTAYSSQCIGYIFLRRRYPTMKRTFNSPFGIAGAVYACFVFICCGISIVAFQPYGSITNSIIGVIFVILLIYYHCYAKSRQTFSEDERKILFFAHIANHNNAKRKHHHHHQHRKANFIAKIVGRIRPKVTASSSATTTAKTNPRKSTSPNNADLPDDC